MKRLLLTGAGGFVGSHALRHVLAETDWDVVCPVTFQHKGLNDRIRLAMDDMPGAAHRVKVVRHDLATPISPITDEAFGPIDYVVNFASESHVDRSITHPAPFVINNVALMVHLLDWARSRSDLQAFVQISTDEVYGPAGPDYAHQEWLDPLLPSNPYSASKAAQEAIAISYWRTYDLPIILTNTMNIIGETQDAEKFVPLVLRTALAGEKMIIHGDEQGRPGSRFYLHARNQADGVLHAMKWAVAHPHPWEDRFHGECLRYSMGGNRPYRFHIVGEREVNNLEMAYKVTNAAGVTLDYEIKDFHSSRPGHDLRYALDGSRMQRIGWEPPVPLDESLEKTVRWTLDHKEWLS